MRLAANGRSRSSPMLRRSRSASAPRATSETDVPCRRASRSSTTTPRRPDRLEVNRGLIGRHGHRKPAYWVFKRG